MIHPNDLLRRAFDGELQSGERERLAIHLASCARCRATLAAQQRVDTLLHTSEQLAPSRDFLQRIEMQVAQMRPPRPAARWYVPLALCLLGLGLMAILPVAEEFAALTTSVETISNALIVWVIAMAGGAAEVDMGSFASLGTQSPLALVFGLCLLGAACVLVLRQQTETA